MSLDRYLTALLICILIIPLNSTAQEKDTVLKKMDIELGEVEVIGRITPGVYSQIARKITVISAEEIKTSPAATLQDLLEYVAFADIRQRNVHGVQADVQFRGGTFDQVMVLLNGVNITDPQTGHFNLDLPVELHSIERIEVLHGSGTRLYGSNAFKGVINIITKKNNNQIMAGIDYGQHGLFHAYATAGLSDGILFNNVSLSRNVSEGFTENTDYKINHFFYQGGIDGRLININWQAGTGGKAFGANDFYSPSFPGQYEETSAKSGSLGFNSKGRVRFSATGYWRRHNDHFLLKRDEPSFYENYHRTDIYGLRSDVLLKSFMGKTSLGAEVRHEGILSSSLGQNLSIPVKVKGADSAYYRKEFARNTTGFFVEHNYTKNNFSVTGGFLIDLSTGIQKKISFYPGVDLVYHLFEEKVKLFTSLNRSLRLPTFTDLFYSDPSNEGNPELIPEKLLAFESGIDFRMPYFSTGITFFRDKGKHVIDWIWYPDDQKYRAMNVTEITTRGIEFRGEHDFKSKEAFSADKIGISYFYIDLEKSSANYESKYSLDHLKHKLQVHFSHTVTKRTGADWRMSYINRNGSYLDYDAGTRTVFSSPFKPYWMVDGRVYYKAERIAVHIDISNLLNTKYTDVGSLIQPGRWITTGIKFNFDYRNR